MQGELIFITQVYLLNSIYIKQRIYINVKNLRVQIISQ
jgi:hypothetical protein